MRKRVTTSVPRHLDLVWVKENTWTRIYEDCGGRLASIQRVRLLVIACVLFGTLSVRAAQAEDVVVGVNMVSPQHMKIAEQDAMLVHMKSAGVRVIRTEITPDEKGVDFARRAYAQGIKINWIVELKFRPGAPKKRRGNEGI